MKSFFTCRVLSTLSLATGLCLAASAQTPVAAETSTSSNSSQRSISIEEASTSSLPEAPLPAMLRASTPDEAAASAKADPALQADPAHKAGPAATNGLGSRTAKASRTQEYIEPGQEAPVLTAGDKILLGLRDPLSIFSAAGWFASAGWEQLNNGSPNYGTDRGAFGQRLGAAAIRSTSESIFTDSVMSPILHTDPRYYRLGRTHNLFARAIYAATRPLITRTDGGSRTLNLALIVGNAGGAALTNLYYPDVNTGAKETLMTFGGSMGGSAIGDLIAEFYDDIVHPHRR